MKIRLLRPSNISSVAYPAGAIVDAPVEEACDLMIEGAAVPVAERADARAERAVLSVPETRTHNYSLKEH